MSEQTPNWQKRPQTNALWRPGLLGVRRMDLLIADYRYSISVAILVLVAIAVRVIIGPHFIDDSYITFRYARNLASGAGFVYNLGERVLGTSTPLFTVLLAVTTRMGIQLENAGLFLPIVFDGGIVILLCKLGRALHSERLGILIGLAHAFSPYSIVAALSGMETTFYAFLVFFALTLFSLGRYWQATLIGVLVTFTRPEGFLVLLAIYGVFILYERRIPFGLILIGGIALLSWIGLATAYFGSPIPNSVVAKAMVYPPDPFPLRNFFQILGRIASPFLIDPVPPIFVIVYTALALGGAWIAMRHNRRLLIMVAWVVMDILFYALPNRYLFPWYTVPLMPFFLMGVSLALAVVIDQFFMHFVSRLSILILRILIAVFLIMVAGLANLATVVTLQGEAYEFAHRESVYRCVGQQIYAHAPESVVASVEIGALGYGFSAKIFDLAGLVTPAALPYYTAPDYHFEFPFSIAPQLIQNQSPSVIVTFDSMIPFRHEPWFVSMYQQVVEYSRLHPYYGSFYVFARKDVKLDEKQINCLPN